MPYFKTSNGVDLYYEVYESKTSKHTIAFFNGVMASVNSWGYLWPVFQKAGFRVILHDFKGQLKSSKPEGPYTFQEHCMEAKELFDFLEVTSLHLVGTSYGGEIAMKMALLYPELVESISIIDSVSELDEVCKGFVSGWKVLCDTNDGETFFYGMAPSIYGPGFLATEQEMIKKRAKAMKNNPDNYLQGQKILYDTFVEHVTMTEELKNIQCPALILCGENDILKPPKFSKIIADNIKNSEYMILPDCGHVAIFEKPKELESAIFGFVMKQCLT